MLILHEKHLTKSLMPFSGTTEKKSDFIMGSQTHIANSALCENVFQVYHNVDWIHSR